MSIKPGTPCMIVKGRASGRVIVVDGLANPKDLIKKFQFSPNNPVLKEDIYWLSVGTSPWNYTSGQVYEIPIVQAFRIIPLDHNLDEETNEQGELA